MSSRTRPLDAIEVRVLGALLEKEQTTPEVYPLDHERPARRLQPEDEPELAWLGRSGNATTSAAVRPATASTAAST